MFQTKVVEKIETF